MDIGARSRERERVDRCRLRQSRARRFDLSFLPGATGPARCSAPVTDGIMLTVKNDSVIGDNMGFPGDGLTSHSQDFANRGGNANDRKTGEWDNDNGLSLNLGPLA